MPSPSRRGRAAATLVVIGLGSGCWLVGTNPNQGDPSDPVYQAMVVCGMGIIDRASVDARLEERELTGGVARELGSAILREARPEDYVELNAQYKDCLNDRLGSASTDAPTVGPA